LNNLVLAVLGTAGLKHLTLYQPQMTDDGGVIDGMKIGKGNQVL
jgi:hypothetical protein